MNHERWNAKDGSVKDCMCGKYVIEANGNAYLLVSHPSLLLNSVIEMIEKNKLSFSGLDVYPYACSIGPDTQVRLRELAFKHRRTILFNDS